MKQTKEVILAILIAVLNIAVFWFWFKAAPLLAGGEFKNYGSFIVPVGGLILSASLFSLAALFAKNKWLAYSSAVIAIGAPYMLAKATALTIGIGLASITLIILAVHRIRKEYSLSLGFSLSKTTKVGLPIYFTIASLIVSVFYFGNITEEKALSSILPKSALNFTLKNLAGPLESLSNLPRGFIEFLNPESTVDEALLKLVEKQSHDQGIDITKVPRQELLRALSSQRGEFAKVLGIKLDGQQKIGDVFYNVISRRIEELLGPYKKYLPVASAIAFFLAFKTFTIPLYYLTTLVTFLLIKIMVWSKILRSEKQQIEVERLTL